MEWYPNKKKADDLLQVLEHASQSWEPTCVTDEIYKQMSSAIRKLVELAKSDPYLIHDWVWAAAQLRIAHPWDEVTARKAWAGIIVFLDLLSKKDSGDQELVPKLRWLTDRVTEGLIDAIGPHAVDRFVSSTEREQIDDLLLRLAEASEPDLQTLLHSAEAVADDFSSVHHSAYFPSVATKLRGLAKLASDQTEKGYWARAALRYVYLEHDVIDDTQGYIGFLDDIQVVEDVHELIHGERSWRALTEHAISQWPMLARIHWTDGKTTNHLPPFLKTTAVCALESVLDDKPERVITTPEIGPLGFVSAALRALADLKAESPAELPPPGTVVTFRQGHLVRFAKMAQPFQAGDGVELPMVELRNNATRYVSTQYASLLEPATAENPKLATINQIEEWIRTLEADQLTPIWKYRRKGVRPSVLYVTDRSRFFTMMDTIRPFGRRLDELVPVAYHTRGGRTTIGTGAATVTAAMTVCNDLATAETAIKVAAEEEQLPQCVIIDRTVDPDSLRGLTHRCRELDPGIRVITFAAPEVARAIAPDENTTSTWLIRPEEIDPIPGGRPSQDTRALGTGPLETFNRRQVSAANVETHTIPVKLDELDRFADLTNRIARRARRDKAPETETVAIACEAALRQISGHAPLGEQFGDESINAALNNVQALAAVHGLFDSEVAKIGEAAAQLIQKLSGFHPKDQLLKDVLERHPNAWVLVGSRAMAEEMNDMSSAKPEKIPQFIAPHDLEKLKEINVLVVPAWFGTQEMRRIMLGGWAPLQIRILFSFEVARMERLNSRLMREFNNLARRTRRSWASFSRKMPDVVPPPPEPSNSGAPARDETDPSQEPPTGDDDTDWLETAIRNRISGHSRTAESRELVTARLVFFDDARHYGVFAKDASLICINEVIGGGSDLSEIDEREAERLLWKKANALAPGDILAFPDDPAYGDIIDGLADALIGDGGTTRRLAGLWRAAVKSIVDQCHGEFQHAKQRLEKYGVNREVSTLAAWLYSSKTVAPKKPDETIPALLKCAGKDDLTAQTEKILNAASAVYRARREAGHSLVTQLSSASINASSGDAFVEISGKQIRYRLLTVSTADGAAPFPSNVLGLHTTEGRIPEAMS